MEPRSRVEEKDPPGIIHNGTSKSFSKTTPDTNSIRDGLALVPESKKPTGELSNLQAEIAGNSLPPLEPDAEFHQLPRIGKQLDEEDSYGKPLSNQLDDDYFSSDYSEYYYAVDDYSDSEMTMSQSESQPGLSAFQRVEVRPFLPGAFALPISEAFDQFDEFGP